MQKSAFVRVYRGFSPLEFYVKLTICQLKLSVWSHFARFARLWTRELSSLVSVHTPAHAHAYPILNPYAHAPRTLPFVLTFLLV